MVDTVVGDEHSIAAKKWANEVRIVWRNELERASGAAVWIVDPLEQVSRSGPRASRKDIASAWAKELS